MFSPSAGFLLLLIRMNCLFLLNFMHDFSVGICKEKTWDISSLYTIIVSAVGVRSVPQPYLVLDMSVMVHVRKQLCLLSLYLPSSSHCAEIIRIT